ncbi:exported hypothetical protein [uncultured Desulfatiglans sp.]|uniref:Uncharacterized protein n=1 Tax=Uncultured Desulfatiglans sp. TaxID=1748965 RepID=A0A653A8H8_UNCDX|nr:exported hypothetical protein [uncultured Desulfatiglans sp.]
MVFLANLGVNLHVCLCGDLQVASAQTPAWLEVGKKCIFRDCKNRVVPANHYRVDTVTERKKVNSAAGLKIGGMDNDPRDERPLCQKAFAGALPPAGNRRRPARGRAA